MKKKSSQNSSKPNRKYVVTPGLLGRFFDFLDHCQAADNSPILLVGPTGVGKSLFLHLYKKFVENDEVSKGSAKPVIGWANCAHFGNKSSDPNIVRSELFGQKGGIGLARGDIQGMVEIVNNGALILEEIGELPLEVQAMLLTFIETGEYRAVGGKETLYANVRIIGATNREGALRKDFKYRFFPFYLPSLNNRREDVLYYLSYKYPELLLSLTKNEVLTLLAYHWPGNVRQIDRVARLLYRDKLWSENIAFDKSEMKSSHQRDRMSRLDKREIQINSDFSVELLEAIAAWGGDCELLESLFNEYGVGLSNESNEPAFKNVQACFDKQYSEQKGLTDLEDKYDVRILLPIEQFEKATKGYLAFCSLFRLYPYKNNNVLDDISGGDYKNFDLEEINYPRDREKEIVNLVKVIMQYKKLISVDDITRSLVPDDLHAFWKELVEVSKTEVNEKQDDQKRSTSQSDISTIFDQREDVLKKYYYSRLLEKTDGNIKSASKIAGLPESTFRSRMDKLGMRYKKTPQERKI